MSTLQFIENPFSTLGAVAVPTTAAEAKATENVEPYVKFNYLVTPEMAQGWLGNSHELQRKIKSFNVKKLLKQFQDGEWKGVHPCAVAITSAGKVTEGQHRLQAVVESGKSWRMTVMFNMPHEIPPTPNAPWQLGDIDVTKVPGSSTKDQSTVVSLATLINGYAPHSLDFTAERYNKISTFFQPGIRWIIDIRERMLARSMLPAPVMAVLVVAYMYRPEAAQEFINLYINGNTLGLQHPINQLITLVRNSDKNTTTQRWELGIRAMRLIKAYFEGATVVGAPKSFYTKEGGDKNYAERSQELLLSFVDTLQAGK